MTNQHHRGPFAAMGVLFFMIGFITVLNDILVPHMKSVFDLSYTQAALIQFCFFAAYFVIAFPSSAVISRLGYQNSIVVGLGVSACGTALFYPASNLQSYPLFLVGLFTLASGFALLQTAMNPYVAVLGPPQHSSARLVLSQAFNSIGTALAPLLGSVLILGASMLNREQLASLTPSAAAAYKSVQAAAVQVPYIVLTSMLVILSVVVAKLSLPKIVGVEGDEEKNVKLLDPLKVPHLLKGVVGVFCYVGAEVGIGSFMVNYFQECIPGISDQGAAQYVTMYWSGAMIGRFAGTFLLSHVRPGVLLTIVSLVNVGLTLSSTMISGTTAGLLLVVCGLQNSIMFPIIFTLAIKDLGVMTNRASSWLVAAILGGAVVPQLQGIIADSFGGLRVAYFIPAACFIYIAYYGIWGSKIRVR